MAEKILYSEMGENLAPSIEDVLGRAGIDVADIQKLQLVNKKGYYDHYLKIELENKEVKKIPVYYDYGCIDMPKILSDYFEFHGIDYDRDNMFLMYIEPEETFTILVLSYPESLTEPTTLYQAGLSSKPWEWKCPKKIANEWLKNIYAKRPWRLEFHLADLFSWLDRTMSTPELFPILVLSCNYGEMEFRISEHSWIEKTEKVSDE